MIHLLPGIAIPKEELRFTASRSGGPGGQNVNKVSSRVTLTFDLKASTTLTDENKRKIRETLGGRINKDGGLRIVSQRTRSQELNRSDAVQRFSDLIRHALIPRPARVKTRIPAGAHKRRIEAKKKRASVKQERSRKEFD